MMIGLKKILHPTDFGDNAAQALKYACAFAEHFGAELHLITVIPDPLLTISPPIGGFLPENYYHDMIKHAEEKLAELPDPDWLKNGKIVREAMEGSGFVEIVQYARSNDIDLIIMGTHGYSALMHLIMGSTAENVMRKASCPVMVVRPDDHQFVMP